MKVIVPVDDSGSSQPAIDTLLGMKWLPGTEIKLLTIQAPADSHGRGGSPVSRHQSEDSLDSLARELEQFLPDCEITARVIEGDPAATIVGLATDWNANLVIMGSRGNKGFNLLLLGSVSQAVLNQAPCPVLVVKSEGAAEERDLQLGFKSVVVTVDNSAYARSALQWVKSISWPVDTRFKIVTVVDSVPDTFSFESNTTKASRQIHAREELMREATAELNSMARDLITVFGPNRVSIQVCEGDPQKTILNVATAARADIIVMGSHGRGGLTKLILGSVSQAIALHAPCAVAVVRGLVRSSMGDLQRTGMFKKPMKEPPITEHTYSAVRPSSVRSEREQEVHIVPFGGM